MAGKNTFSKPFEYDDEGQVFRPVSLISRLRSEYGKEMPISTATCTIEPGSRWNRSPGLIEISKPEFSQPRKEARFIITVKRPCTLEEVKELIVPRIPVQLNVTLYSTPSPVSGASGVPMVPPQTDSAMLTIPQIPLGKIVFDHPVPDIDELELGPDYRGPSQSYPVVIVKAKVEPSNIFQKDSPEFLIAWREGCRFLSFAESGKQPIIEPRGTFWGDGEWICQKFRCNQVPEYGKPLTAGVKASATVFGSLVEGTSSITFNPWNKYILVLSSKEVKLTGIEGSFRARVIDETPQQPYIVSTAQISVHVPPDAERFLSVSPRETRSGDLTCKIVRKEATTITSVPLKISARVGEQSLPDSPTVMVYLGEKRYRILCTPPEAVTIDMKKFSKKKGKVAPLEALFSAEIEVFDYVENKFVADERETLKGSVELSAYQKNIRITEEKEKPNRYRAKISVASPISLKNEAETVGAFSVWAEKPLQGLQKVVIPIQVLKAEPPQVELIVKKRGFAPVTINITDKNPALATTLGSEGAVLTVPTIQGVLELEGLSAKDTIEYATGVLRVGEKEYFSVPDEKDLQIIVGESGITHPFTEPVQLTFDDQEIRSKLEGIQRELKNFPSENTAADFTPQINAYSKKCLELFAKEKNSALEDQDLKPGLASLYSGRIAKTWAFIRFARDIYPLLGRSEKITEQAFSRATENLIDCFIQVALAVTPWVYEKLRQSPGSPAPSIDDLKPIAKEVVEKGLQKQFGSAKEILKEGREILSKELLKNFKNVHGCIVDIDTIIRTNCDDFNKIVRELKDQLKDLPPESASKISGIINQFPSSPPAHPFSTIDLSSMDSYGDFSNQLINWRTEYFQYEDKLIESFISLNQAFKKQSYSQYATFEKKCIGLLEGEFKATSKSFHTIGQQAKKIEAVRTTDVILSELGGLLDQLVANPSLYTKAMIREKVNQIQENALKSLKSFEDLKIFTQYNEIVQHHNEMLDSLVKSLPEGTAEELVPLKITELQKKQELTNDLVKICNEHLIDMLPDVGKSPETQELIKCLRQVEARKSSHYYPVDEFGVEDYYPRDKIDEHFVWVSQYSLFLQAMQYGAEVSSSYLEAMGKTMNTLTLNITKCAGTYLTSFSYQSYFSDESVTWVREQLPKWNCTEDYFGMGSKYRQISDLAEKLNKRPIEPILSKEDMPQKRNTIIAEFERTDKREAIISTVFHRAVAGSLDPATLVSAPDVKSEDIGMIRNHLNAISEKILSFEQAYTRAESLTQLPFYERWYRYVTEDLGSAMEGGTSADVDQIIEWFAWIGSMVFMILSIVLPVTKVVKAGTMVWMVTKKDFVDIFTAAIRFITSCFGSLDIVSSYYRDLLVLFGITYIGFYVSEVDFESIKKKTVDPDPYSVWGTYKG